MIFEGVNFNVEEIAKMSREDFVARHESVFWQDRDGRTRKKMLGQVYDLANPAAKPKKKSVE